MSVLSRQSILKRAGIITPFFPDKTLHPQSGTTFGCGACGYDVRLRQDIIILGMETVLASTMEHFDMPGDLMGYVNSKSSVARYGMEVKVHQPWTKIDPGWRGYLTLELSMRPLRGWVGPLVLEAGTPIAEITFHLLDVKTDTPYAGKYQDQPDRPVEAIHEEALQS